MVSSGTLYMGLAWAVVIVAITLVFGRIFCSWICPLGILNQLAAAIFPKKRSDEEKMAQNRPRELYHFKYYILVFLLVAASFGSLQIGLLDPICLTIRSFSTSIFPAGHELSQALYPQLNFNWGVGHWRNLHCDLIGQPHYPAFLVSGIMSFGRPARCSVSIQPV